MKARQEPDPAPAAPLDRWAAAFRAEREAARRIARMFPVKHWPPGRAPDPSPARFSGGP